MGKQKLPTKSFKDWEAEEVEEAFGLIKRRTLPFLEEIKTIRIDPNHEYLRLIEQYRLDALDLVNGWNEDEYKFLFISPFLKLVNFSNKYFNVFTQRPMSVLYENGTKETAGKVEWMLARGKQQPKQPHFFLHEYKPENKVSLLRRDGREADPLGQLLIAMVAAQILNADEKPIYGIYVNGRNWFFVVLDANEYAVSLAYDITSDDIFDLFAILELVRDKMAELYKPVMV